MTPPIRIAVVGYGIAGIAAAIHLRRLGHLIDHYERHVGVSTGGGGLLLQPATLDLLRELGLGAGEFPLGARINGFGARNLKGRTLTQVRYADHVPGRHALGIQRRYLVQRMHEVDQARERVHFSHAVASVDAQRGILRLDDGGERGPYGLIIAADGAGSPLRSGHPDMVQRDHLYASAALVVCVDDPDQLAGDQLIQYFDNARHVAVWSVGASGDGEPKRANLSLNIPLEQAEAVRTSGEWRAIVARHCPRIAGLLDHHGNDCSPLIYAYRDVNLRRMASGRLVFVGDAAHSMSPLLGQGARLALLDASNLAKALQAHADVPSALNAFDRSARSYAGEFQRVSRWLTPVFQSEGRLLAAMRHSVQIAHRMPFVAAKVRALLIGESK